MRAILCLMDYSMRPDLYHHEGTKVTKFGSELSSLRAFVLNCLFPNFALFASFAVKISESESSTL